MYFKKKAQPVLDPEKIRKGQVLIVKVPPFYDKEYFYEITGAGGKLVRAKLFHSPTVKKQWSFEDLELLARSNMVRLATDEEVSLHEQHSREVATDCGEQIADAETEMTV